MKLKKVDGRMNGHNLFKYYVSFGYNSHQNFCDIREWCWEQWGPSCEFEYWSKINSTNGAWCWVSDKYTKRIYLATDKEGQWFLLKWGS